MEPAVFLDRDNTLIVNDGDLGDPNQVRIIPGVPAGLLALRKAGYRLVVVTNQAGVARGKFTEADVDAVHQRIASLIEDEVGSESLIDRFYYCPYHPEGTRPEYRRDHSWRKPHPGMLVQAARDMGLDLSRSWLIGDQQRDIRAGKAAGCRTVLINADPALTQEANPTVAVGTFAEAVDAVLRRNPGAMSREQAASAQSESGAEAGGAMKVASPPSSATAASAASTAAMEKNNSEGAPVTKSEAAEQGGLSVSERGREVRSPRDGGKSAGHALIEPRAAVREQVRTEAGGESRAGSAWPESSLRSGPVKGEQPISNGDMAELKRAVVELAEEIRSQRVHATEFTLLKLAAGACQLLVLLLVLLGLLEVNDMQAFAKWFLGATLTQLVTIALLLLDMRG